MDEKLIEMELTPLPRGEWAQNLDAQRWMLRSQYFKSCTAAINNCILRALLKLDVDKDIFDSQTLKKEITDIENQYHKVYKHLDQELFKKFNEQ